MYKKYTPEQINFVRKIATGKHTSEIADMFYQKFGIKITISQVRTIMYNNGIKNGRFQITTAEQDSYMRSIAKGKTSEELRQILLNKFGVNFSKQQMRSYMNRKKIVNGLDCKFKIGQIPPNKGKNCRLSFMKRLHLQCSKKGTGLVIIVL